MRGSIRGASVLLLGLALSSLLLAGTASAQDLDLREANVVGVEYSGEDGSYGFDVTLYHDDDGESGYADWWQVESLDGERLGRRSLAHPHGTREFTRSTTVDIPSDVSEVVVRGHDQTHGYGGRAVVLNLSSGETEALMQGPEPEEFSRTPVGPASAATPSPDDMESAAENGEGAIEGGTAAPAPTGDSNEEDDSTGGEDRGDRGGEGDPNGSVPGFGAALSGLALAVALASKV